MLDQGELYTHKFKPEFFFSGFNFTSAIVVCILTAMINHVFISFSAVQIYHIIHLLFHKVFNTEGKAISTEIVTEKLLY